MTNLTPAKRNQPQLAWLAAQAVDRLGTADFYDKLLDILGSAANHDLAALVRYSRASPPDLIIPRIEPNAPMTAYYQHFYAFDPFYRHWIGNGRTGVFQLCSLDSNIGNSLYAREFLAAMSISDEIAVFLPAFGDACPTLILDRATGNFTKPEMARVRSLFPLLSALHNRHLDVFIASGMVSDASPIGQHRPLRLVDANGFSLFETQSWIDIASRTDKGVTEALAVITERGPCVINLPGHLTLRRTQLPNDFGPAPNGYCDEVTADTGQKGRQDLEMPNRMAAKLSEREQQIALKMLQGNPVLAIAKKLRLSVGTVKNYRTSIYRKLDITTERELFGEFIAEMSGREDMAN